MNSPEVTPRIQAELSTGFSRIPSGYCCKDVELVFASGAHEVRNIRELTIMPSNQAHICGRNVVGNWLAECKTAPYPNRAFFESSNSQPSAVRCEGSKIETQQRRTAQPLPSLILQIYGEHRSVRPSALLGSTSWPLMCPSFPSSLFDLASLPIMLAFSSAGTKTSHS
jgi:hypothetical protein